MMPRTLGRICTMGYYSDFDIDITIKDVSEATVKDIVERTFGEWIAGQLRLQSADHRVFVSGSIYDTKWYRFTEDVNAFRNAITEAGGKFAWGELARQGEEASDGERFGVEDGRLVRQVTQVTWVTAED